MADFDPLAGATGTSIDIGVHASDDASATFDKIGTSADHMGERLATMAGHMGDAAKRGLGPGADAIGHFGDRFENAFERLEKREPTLLLRRVQLAMEEMGASAVGVEGPMGRLIASMALMAPGSEIGFGIVAGLGAVAGEIHSVLDFTNSLDSALERLNMKFAATVKGAGDILTTGQLGEALSPGATKEQEQAAGLPEQPGLFARFASRIQGIAQAAFSAHGTEQGAMGDVEAAFVRQMESALNTINQNITRKTTERERAQDEERMKRAEEANAPLDRLNAEIRRLGLGSDPLGSQLAKVNGQVEQAMIALNMADGPRKDEILDLLKRKDQLEINNALEKERLAALTRENEVLKLHGFAPLATGTREEQEARAAALAVALPGRGAEPVGPHLGGLPPLLPEILRGHRGTEGGIMFGAGGVGGAAPAPAEENTIPAIMQGVGGQFGNPLERTGGLAGATDQAMKQANDINTRNTEATQSLTAQMELLLAGISQLAAGVRGGGPGGFITGLGGLAKEAGGIKGLEALSPIGTELSLAGGAISLFSGLFHHEQKVTITRIEDEALQKVKEVLQLPRDVSVVVVGGANPRDTKFALDRFAAKGGVSTLPGTTPGNT